MNVSIATLLVPLIWDYCTSSIQRLRKRQGTWFLRFLDALILRLLAQLWDRLLVTPSEKETVSAPSRV